MIIPTNVRAYQQNQNLSARLIQSLILYLEDILPESKMHPHQVAQSKDAILTLIGAAGNNVTDDEAIQIPILRIFSRISFDVTKTDIQSIRKDIVALKKILTIV